jgi:hypothetical protein
MDEQAPARPDMPPTRPIQNRGSLTLFTCVLLALVHGRFVSCTLAQAPSRSSGTTSVLSTVPIVPVGCPQTFVHAAGERMQKRNERAFLFGAESNGPDVGSEKRIRPSTFGIKFDDGLEGREAAVVHVGRSAGDFAERRRLERAAIARVS